MFGSAPGILFGCGFADDVENQDYILNTAIGGWWAFNSSGRGAVVSALGINRAMLTHWQTWNEQAWKKELANIRPHLIILAYGTNEVYNEIVSEDFRAILTKTIREIRSVVSTTSIIILNASKILKNQKGTCGTRPTALSNIQSTQLLVALEERTLYWDWQAAMGGECSMKSWIQRGLARKDGVHFTPAGYEQLGYRMAQDLLNLRK